MPIIKKRSPSKWVESAALIFREEALFTLWEFVYKDEKSFHWGDKGAAKDSKDQKLAIDQQHINNRKHLVIAVQFTETTATLLFSVIFVVMFCHKLFTLYHVITNDIRTKLKRNKQTTQSKNDLEPFKALCLARKLHVSDSHHNECKHIIVKKTETNPYKSFGLTINRVLHVWYLGRILKRIL